MLREKLARFIGEEKYRDDFYGDSVTEQDREYCRRLAGEALRLVAEWEVEQCTEHWDEAVIIGRGDCGECLQELYRQAGST